MQVCQGLHGQSRLDLPTMSHSGATIDRMGNKGAWSLITWLFLFGGQAAEWMGKLGTVTNGTAVRKRLIGTGLRFLQFGS